MFILGGVLNKIPGTKTKSDCDSEQGIFGHTQEISTIELSIAWCDHGPIGETGNEWSSHEIANTDDPEVCRVDHLYSE